PARRRNSPTQGSEECPGGCQGLTGVTLQVQNGEFVGVVNGQVMCSGADMVGASFDVLVPRGTRAMNSLATVTIDARDTIDTIDTIDGLSESVPTYRLFWVP